MCARLPKSNRLVVPQAHLLVAPANCTIYTQGDGVLADVAVGVVTLHVLCPSTLTASLHPNRYPRFSASYRPPEHLYSWPLADWNITDDHRRTSRIPRSEPSRSAAQPSAGARSRKHFHFARGGGRVRSSG